MLSSELLTSFQNTENAFAYKSDARLKKAYFLFSVMRYNWLVKIGSRLTPWAIRNKLPVKLIIRKTLFEQFVGGENLSETNEVVHQLSRFGAQVILDYGVEGGAHNEQEMEAACREFINVIEHASGHTDIPFISIKVTGMVRFALLEKIDALMSSDGGLLAERYQKAIASLPETEQKEWAALCGRLDRVCKAASEKNTGVLIDAEETWIQDPIDALTMEMMAQYNREKAVVYNTAQMYRHDRLDFVKACHAVAEEKKFILALKIVRGAYMEKERARAQERGYASPIQPNKESSDRDFDAAVLYCMDRIERVAIVVASHNEESNLKAIRLMRERGLPNDHSHVHLSQLFGMSDHITFNLAAAGYRVSKYLPFGPIEDVVPYLMRRAQENTSVAGQTTRELELLKAERRRRAK